VVFVAIRGVSNYFRYFQMIEYFRMNIEDLRLASGGSILKTIIKLLERSDIHKYSIVNIQSSIPARPG